VLRAEQMDYIQCEQYNTVDRVLIVQILTDTSFVSQKNCDDIISYRVEKTSGTDDRFSALIHMHALSIHLLSFFILSEVQSIRYRLKLFTNRL